MLDRPAWVYGRPDETAHLISEYRINAARMRERANAVRNPAEREQFEQIARELEKFADVLASSEEGSKDMTRSRQSISRNNDTR
jgi:hypothetical protein